MEGLWPMQREVIARMMLRGCTFERYTGNEPVATWAHGKPVYTHAKRAGYYCIADNGDFLAQGEDIYGAAVAGEERLEVLERVKIERDAHIGLGDPSLFHIEED